MSSPTPQPFVEADPTTREVRDLKNTISALRQSVEAVRAESDQRVQEAVAASQYEITQLKATAAALRQALEEERAARDTKVREALRAASDEIAQLKAAVGALRESLEKTAK
jgi:HAMP domain-containing protein